ncbi:hypothetical protein [Roseofilum capinflatum]|uniref:Uncharacterized protein n=1 Tax=Roseofilum capinflatum BLCC-M114 TaxID=3022440 RepID=A0ABT7B112_9CYAN|nr:hypothetical protein [Roseofilum capinflatum]MDJ1172858.1 hypothetical protein [Roseofilum capinflatum BLCC-M114]
MDVSWGPRQRLKRAKLMQSRFTAVVNKFISDGVLQNTWLGLSDDVKPGRAHNDEIKKMKPEARRLVEESSQQFCLLINTTRNSLNRIVERYEQLIPALEYNQTKSRMADWKDTKEHEQSIAKHEGRIRECQKQAKTLGVTIGDMSYLLE